MFAARGGSLRAVCSTLLLFNRFSIRAKDESLAVLLSSAEELTRDARAPDLTADNVALTIRGVRRGLALARLLDSRPRPDCLPRALAAFVVLRRSGVDASLRVGARKYPFAAHAWVEVDGLCVTDRVAEWTLYHPMLSIP